MGHSAKLNLLSLPGAIAMRSGMPYLDWSLVDTWIDDNIPEDDQDEAWTEAACQWLDLLVAALPKGYALFASENCLLLSIDDDSWGDQLLLWAEAAREFILKTLPGVAQAAIGRQVILNFHDQNAYLDYISEFYPETGAFGLSSAVCIKDGYAHIVTWLGIGRGLERAITHEMNHLLLRHLPLPMWLNEGVTQVMEDVVLGSNTFLMSRERMYEHRKYWNEKTIQTFWSGGSFHSAGGLQHLSYELAQVLVRNLMADRRKQMLSFIANAHYEDAGEAALDDICGMALSDRVAEFLGPGDWRPRSLFLTDEQATESA